jgi:hypothetical protein
MSIACGAGLKMGRDRAVDLHLHLADVSGAEGFEPAGVVFGVT